jgi:hypothetical protein
MPSRALQRWESSKQVELDRLEAAHAAVGGTGVGRRTATQQINDAYIVLIAAYFQQYCRDLHTEAATALASTVKPTDLREMIQAAFIRNRQLDRGNAQPSSLGSDFGILGLNLWDTLKAMNKLNPKRQQRLEQLNIWRNAIAHQSFKHKPDDAAKVAGTTRNLDFARACRSSCLALAREIDKAVGKHVAKHVDPAPW